MGAVRTPVPGHLVFGVTHRARPSGSSARRRRPACRLRRWPRASPLRRPGRGAGILPSGTRTRNLAGQDAHALSAMPGMASTRGLRFLDPAHPSRRCCSTPAPELGVRRSTDLAAVPRSRYRFLLDEAGILHHELHQGLCAPDGAGCDSRPVLGVFHGSEARLPGGRRRAGRTPGQQPAPARLLRQRLARSVRLV